MFLAASNPWLWIEPRLMSVAFGAQELLRRSATTLRLGTQVTGVAGSAGDGYSLYGAGREMLGTFDAVLIAAPISLAQISIDVRDEVSELPWRAPPPTAAPTA